MLESVALGILISMIELIWRIHAVGCVHHETTGALTRSALGSVSFELVHQST